jgi:hypothetical protein
MFCSAFGLEKALHNLEAEGVRLVSEARNQLPVLVEMDAFSAGTNHLHSSPSPHPVPSVAVEVVVEVLILNI